jgi:hypothetical protein
MTTVDYALIAIVLISLLFGAIRGFLRESVALLVGCGLWLRRYALPSSRTGGTLTARSSVWVK